MLTTTMHGNTDTGYLLYQTYLMREAPPPTGGVIVAGAATQRSRFARERRDLVEETLRFRDAAAGRAVFEISRQARAARMLRPADQQQHQAEAADARMR